MTIEERYGKRYKSGDTAWSIGQPDFNLINFVTKKPILSCKVLDIGCGTGDNGNADGGYVFTTHPKCRLTTTRCSGA